MKRIIISVILCASTLFVANATQYSKLSIITIAKQIGCWKSLKAYIANADMADEFDACQYISDTHPLFSAATNALVAANVCTAEDIGSILSASVDTAVDDAFLRRVYESDMTTLTGRSRWHGKKLREVVDTNTLTKVTYYEDGTTFTDRATEVKKNVKTTKTTMDTNGVPVRLANARARREAESTTVSNVTVFVSAGM